MPIDADLRQRIASSAAVGFPDQIAFTQQLVRCPSTRGNEHTVQDLMARELRARGMAVDVFAMEDADLARHPGGSNHLGDAFAGAHRRRHPPPADGNGPLADPAGPCRRRAAGAARHVDDPALRSGDPRRLDVGPRCWRHEGRRARPTVFALDALRRIGLQPAATVYVQSVVEEEITGNGALMTHLRGYKADAALIPEPGNEGLTRGNLGVLWFQIEVRGIPVHVANMGTGANAIDAAWRVIGALRQLEERWNAKAKAHPLFGAHHHPINLNLGKIEGGDWASSVPAWCSIDCRIAFFPGTSAAEAAAEIEVCITNSHAVTRYLANNPPRVVWNGFFAEGYGLEPGIEGRKDARGGASGGDRVNSSRIAASPPISTPGSMRCSTGSPC